MAVKVGVLRLERCAHVGSRLPKLVSVLGLDLLGHGRQKRRVLLPGFHDRLGQAAFKLRIGLLQLAVHLAGKFGILGAQLLCCSGTGLRLGRPEGVANRPFRISGVSQKRHSHQGQSENQWGEDAG